MSIQIWIPGSAEQNYLCRLCKATFRTGPAYESHVKRCADSFAAEIEQRADESRWLSRIWDPDLEKFMQENRERQVQRGHL